MSRDERIVRHVRLRASSEAAVRRAALQLEDALRTASLPGAGGRTVLVRRLALGRIACDGASQTIALAIERRIDELGALCVHGDNADAASAPAVWFRDALDAHERLALRVAAGRGTDAWYWPLAVPAWRRDATRSEALRQIGFSLAARAEAPAALPHWAAALVGAGHASKLLAALRIADVEPLARAAGIPAGALAARSRAGARAGASSGNMPGAGEPNRRLPIGYLAAAPLARPDPRIELLHALLRVAGADATNVATSEAGFERVSRTAPRWRRPEAAHAAPSLSQFHPSRIAPVQEGTPCAHGDARCGLLHESDPSARGNAMPTSAPVTPPGRTTPAHAPNAGSSPAAREPLHFLGAPTRAGGLAFLVTVLVRIGYAQWLEAQPEWAPFDVARRTLTLAADRLGIEDDDPIRPLAAAGMPRRGLPLRFVSPAAWQPALCAGRGGPLLQQDGSDEACLRDASGRLMLAAWRGTCPRRLMRAVREAGSAGHRQPAPVGGSALQPQCVADAWLTAARRWLRRNAGIGLADLVLRPAELALTPTHVDLFFDHDEADLRLRRAGLDLDPGWVPWFGRVIGYHYESLR